MIKQNLTREKVEALDKLGFIWTPRDAQWDSAFDELALFFKDFGHANVPPNFLTKSGFNLGTWARQVRSRKSMQNEKRLERLAEINFVWRFDVDTWQQPYEELVEYYKTNGDCLVNKKYTTQTGLKLGNWVYTQRTQRFRMTKDRLQKLKDINFVWNVNEFMWEQAYSALLEYRKKYGDCRVNIKYKTPNEFKLGIWVSTQRSKKDKLAPERLKKLDAIGFVWKII